MTKADEQRAVPERAISRRDFLEGATQSVAAIIAASAAAPAIAAAPTKSVTTKGAAKVADAQTVAAPAGPNYPPAMQGMRGQNDASFQYAHALRDGTLSAPAQETGEVYDLVVVGAGMSGLAAAYFYRKRLPHAKILILDNCDDFGGHARRNEFTVNDRLLMANGGAVLLLNPNTYSPEGKALLADIGIDFNRYWEVTGKDVGLFDRMKLGRGAFFHKEAWGTDRLVPDYPDIFSDADRQTPQKWQAFVAKAPVDSATGADLLRIVNERKDYLAGQSVEQKIATLRRMSYASYLKKFLHVGDKTLKFLQNQTDSASFNSAAAGPDSFSAWAAYRVGLGGFDGLGLRPDARNMSTFLPDDEVGAWVMLPDGNGGVARLLVRSLIPQALPGHTFEDAVVARVNYPALDQEQNAVRLRLNSTVVRAQHVGDPGSAKEVDVTYVNDGRGYTVKARGVVMACFNAVVPYLCPELPQEQKDALHMQSRKALIVVNAAVRNWRAFAKAGVYDVVCPSGFYANMSLVSNPGFGSYSRAQTPEEPTIVQLFGGWNSPGLPSRDQNRVGRAQMLGISLETFEKEARDQLQRAMGPYGFDADRDIAGITVNRWAHGVTGGANDLFDPEWPRDEAPWVKGRKRFGLITIANSDSGATALTQCAFDQAHRAVSELMYEVIRPQGDFAQGERI